MFYSHGFIVEGNNPTPKNERWGVYEFPAIKAALSDEEYHLIAYHRAKGSDPFKHAKALANNVEELIKYGVDADHITIMGFSRGAFITSLTSHYLKETPVNAILLAGCGRIVSKKYADIKLNGDVLSVYETSDDASTCQKLKNRSDNLKSFKEIAISTGKEHGAFYTPLPEWIVPVKQWIKEKYTREEKQPHHVYHDNEKLLQIIKS
ncbi:alpha/beta hydrolase [uncultured Shewanella sp.]|uniref:alpha/beta hydrolase n=1 Tax=uncultured Shewanella sp. TaxID=173975 RepID=UPI002609BA6A|nr:alpha/beta hydrolase [uncultured Shewanella sp.]